MTYEKQIPNGTVGDVIRAARKKQGLTREQLAVATDIPIYWLGRWERNRSVPSAADWNKLDALMKLPVL